MKCHASKLSGQAMTSVTYDDVWGADTTDSLVVVRMSCLFLLPACKTEAVHSVHENTRRTQTQRVQGQAHNFISSFITLCLLTSDPVVILAS